MDQLGTSFNNISASNYGSSVSSLNNLYAVLLSATAIAALFYIWNSIALMKMFKKANIAGWTAWIPVVNVWSFLQMSGQKGYLALLPLLLLLGFINPWLVLVGVFGCLVLSIILIVAAYKIAKSFNKNPAGYTLLYIFLGIIYVSILGFGKSRWSITGEIPIKEAPIIQSTYSTPANNFAENNNPPVTPMQDIYPQTATPTSTPTSATTVNPINDFQNQPVDNTHDNNATIETNQSPQQETKDVQ